MEDEDQGPEDRAADRAERFAMYRDKRSDEAHGFADRYDAGPSAHGFQSQARAERAAARHDRIAGYACDAWSKAEYWQRRTAGVISHALHLSSPGVRMGRIKELEASQRKALANLEEYKREFATWRKILELEDPEKITAAAIRYTGGQAGWSNYWHPRRETRTDYYKENKSSLYTFLTLEADRDPITGEEACALFFATHHHPDSEEFAASGFMQWVRHYELRLAYENQMLEAQGGRAAFVEMEPGGFIGGKQIQKVNKSNATGRVVSVALLGPTSANYDRKGKPYGEGNPRPLVLHTINIERFPESAYRPPTDEERAAFLEAKKEAKKNAPKAPPCPLINPTDEDAERLQAVWNERALDAYKESHLRRYGKDYAEQFKPATVCRIPQAVYSANSKGAYARAETRGLCADMILEPRESNLWRAGEKEEREARGPALCMIRQTYGDGTDGGARRVIVITDKPQKPLPAGVWKLRQAPAPTIPVEVDANGQASFVLA